MPAPIGRRVFLAAAILTASSGCAPEPPYPPSEIEMRFDFDARVERAPGSDNWALTASAAGTQWAAWGDGGGFGGSNSSGRVSLGVARIEGSHPDFRAVNVWGGLDALAPATFEGKSYGLLARDGHLYMWVSPGSDLDNYREARLAVSDDEARTWTLADWAFSGDDDLVVPAFLQRPPLDSPSRVEPASEGGPTEWIYAYFIRRHSDASKLSVQRPGAIDLARAPGDRLMDRAAWEFYAGLDVQGTPRWTGRASERLPVFEDANGVGWCVSVSYSTYLGRYVLCTEHSKSFVGNLGWFEAPAPWGPWRTIGYASKWGPESRPHRWFYGNLAPAWFSGPDFVFVATGIRDCDQWMSVPGEFVPRADTP